ncbi:thiol-disulfide oxidoreductase ResA [Caldalkalibacillus salinus]|uniref:thiol-disulfide oxidoreductase ResA n=1 Tax=Caldalkalibacillus salinus TaxID=2803787 RepID=UPI001923A76D
MRDKRTLLRFSVLIVIFLALGSAFYTAYMSEQGPLPVGEEVPDFELEALDGDVVRLSDFRGKAVFVNFWGTWCEPCKVEMPLMQEYYEENGNEAFEILAVNIRESELAVSSFVNKRDLTFPILLDRHNKVTNLYNVGTLPASYFIDAQGRLVDYHVGMLDEESIEELVESAVNAQES